MADAFGRMVADYHAGDLAEQPVYERSDGDRSPAQCAWYFAGPEDWGLLEHAAIEACRGRVIDAGCGVGRALPALTDRGHAVLGIDASPGSVRVAADRVVEPVVVGDMRRPPVAEPRAAPAVRFDSALFLGTHVGAVASHETALADVRSLLRTYAAVLGRETGPGPRLVADVYDPTRVVDEDLLAYLADRRVEEGIATRRFRLRYAGAVGRWRTLLQCSPDALRRIVAPTPWSVADVERGEGTRYVFVLEERSGRGTATGEE